jgi:hypothetical protein
MPLFNKEITEVLEDISNLNMCDYYNDKLKDLIDNDTYIREGVYNGFAKTARKMGIKFRGNKGRKSYIPPTIKFYIIDRLWNKLFWLNSVEELKELDRLKNNAVYMDDS